MYRSVIHFIYRAQSHEHSIERVFENILPLISEQFDIRKTYASSVRLSLRNIFKDIKKCYRRRGDINHITGQVHYCDLLLPSPKTVITIHDLGSIKDPIKRFLIDLFSFYIPLWRARAITCVSNTTKERLINHYPFIKNKEIRVIYNSVGEDFKYTPREFNKDKPTILHIGTRSNKNLERVISALSGVNCHLRIVGLLSDDQIHKLITNSIDYSNVFNISDKEIVNEYEKCDIVSFPSTFEGFGMPIVEANSIGRVVLTSNILPLTEISHGAAMHVDPFSIEEIKKGFLKLMEDSKLRDELIRNGLENAKNYMTNNIANQYISLYNDMLTYKI